MAWHSWLQLYGWEIELLFSTFAFRRVDGKLIGPAEGFSIARMSIGLFLHRVLWLGLSRIALRLIVESL
jgi:hypothetical protein